MYTYDQINIFCIEFGNKKRYFNTNSSSEGRS